MGFTDIFGGQTLQPAQVAYRALGLGANITLVWPPYSVSATDYVAGIMDVTPSGPGFTVTMPDARLVSAGTGTLWRNLGADAFTVADSTGAVIASIAAGTVRYVYLQSNATAAGTWASIVMGVGSSNLDASQLAGSGLAASGNTLEFAPVTRTLSVDYTILTTDRSVVFVWTGGSGTLTLPTLSAVQPNWSIEVRNAGTGTLTVAPVGGVQIDGSANIALQATESGFVHSGPTAWYTVGRGRNTQFNFTKLTKTVTGGTTTLSSTEAANVVQQYSGTLLSDETVVVPAVVQVYYMINGTTGAHTFTVETAVAGGATVTIDSGTAAILFCDGTNVINCTTSGVSVTSLAAGSVGAPSLSFAGDPSTGVYQPSSGQFAISISGTRRGLFTATGLNGTAIGATTPSTGAFTSVNKVTITTPATGATLTIPDGATLATSGAYSLTLTATAATNVTLPTTGTLATLAGAEALTNKTGVFISNPGLGINWNGAVANGSTTSPFYVNSNHYGPATITAGANLNAITVGSDQVALTSTQAVNGFAVTHNFGGGSSKGSRQAVQVYLTQTAATASKVGGVNPYFVSGAFYSIAQFSEGGTGPSYTTGYGHVFGLNPVARLTGTATNFYEVTGMEINVSAATGTTVGAKKGLQIVKEAADVVSGGDGIDTAIFMGDQSGSTAGWNYGLTFGAPSAQWPMNSASTLIWGTQGNVRSVPPNAANGVDFSKVKFSASAFKSMGFSVSGAGALSAASATIGSATITSNGGGTVIDVPNVVARSVTINAGGTGYAANDRIRTALGGVYEVNTVSGGAVTAVTMLVPDVSNGAAPANPVATTADYTGVFSTGGSGCTLNITWASSNQLRVVPTSGTLLIGTDGAASNGFSIVKSALGTGATLTAFGGSSDIDIVIAPKGPGSTVAFDFPGSGTFFTARKSGAGAVAAIPYTKSGTTGVPVEFGADSSSSDTNVDAKFVTKGSGVPWFGAHTGSADAPVSGYITIKDSGGTLRKLAVIT